MVKAFPVGTFITCDFNCVSIPICALIVTNLLIIQQLLLNKLEEPIGKMFLKPSLFQDFLSRNNCIDDIYEAMAKDDLSEVVTAALHILRKTHNLPFRFPIKKLESTSTEQRKKGNEALADGRYQMALMCYNNAMLLAPKGSKAMVLAISNRSAVLQKLRAYKACLKDVESCLSMDCPAEVIGKLKRRKKDVTGKAMGESIFTDMYKICAQKNITCKPNNSELPCATADISATGSVLPKILASNNIKVGTVIAFERAYVSYTNQINSLFTCHYCQKMSLNLLPCDGCCYALFCDEECKKQCYDEYHKYECYILDGLREICYGPLSNLMVKAAIKMRSNSDSWSELIAASHSMGIERIKLSSNKEIYDKDSLFSALNLKDDKLFVVSIKYDASFVCAAIIHYLLDIPSFFPDDAVEQRLAIEAFSRIMMFLSMYVVPKELIQAVTTLKTDVTNYHEIPNYGLFSFIGKLNNSCTPNTVVCNINNKLSLIAIQGIKSGEEITIPFQRHWLEEEFNRHNRNVMTFLYNGTVCSCNICCGTKVSQPLSESQKIFYSRINFKGIDKNLLSINIPAIYDKLLEALEVLKDVPQSPEYIEIYNRFKRCRHFYGACLSNNLKLDALF